MTETKANYEVAGMQNTGPKFSDKGLRRRRDGNPCRQVEPFATIIGMPEQISCKAGKMA
jgi:hypothetical protein